MALVRNSNRIVNELHQYSTSRTFDGKPVFKATVQFINSKPKHNFNDGPNAFVQMCVENRGSTQDWFLSVEDLREIADACDAAIAQLQPYVRPTLEEVK